MTGNRPRPKLILDAILQATNNPESKGRLFIIVEPLVGHSVDAAFLLLKEVEILRDEYPNRAKNKKDLRKAVARAAAPLGLPPDRRYGYEVICMNYYNILSVYRRQKLEAFKARQPILPKPVPVEVVKQKPDPKPVPMYAQQVFQF